MWLFIFEVFEHLTRTNADLNQLDPYELTNLTNLNVNKVILVEENKLENVVCQMSAILFRPQCIK